MFHYTSADALASIIDSGRFRFGQLRRMNDPRENRTWDYNIQSPADISEAERPALQAEFDQLVRSPVRIIAATVEDPRKVGDSDDATFLRGFSRSRNWAQYADDHRGACLVLDRQALLRAVSAEAAGYAGATVHAERVIYEDRQATRLEAGPFIEVRRSPGDWSTSAAAEAARWHAEHWRDLFFRKNLDWASEREYRIAVIGVAESESFEVDLTDALLAIALGVEFPPHHESVLDHRLNSGGFPYTVVGKMTYRNGAPDVTGARFGLEPRMFNDASLMEQLEELRQIGHRSP